MTFSVILFVLLFLLSTVAFKATMVALGSNLTGTQEQPFGGQSWKAINAFGSQNNPSVGSRMGFTNQPRGASIPWATFSKSLGSEMVVRVQVKILFLFFKNTNLGEMIRSIPKEFSLSFLSFQVIVCCLGGNPKVKNTIQKVLGELIRSLPGAIFFSQRDLGESSWCLPKASFHPDNPLGIGRLSHLKRISLYFLTGEVFGSH